MSRTAVNQTISFDVILWVTIKLYLSSNTDLFHFIGDGRTACNQGIPFEVIFLVNIEQRFDVVLWATNSRRSIALS